MRARNIKPGFFKDEELAALPFESRLLFPGLWMLADAEGRLEDRPRWIKSEVFPYDDTVSAAKVHALLQMLHDAGFILRYESGGEKYIQVTNFLRHQNPHKNERDKGSRIPSPSTAGSVPKNTGVVPSEDGTSTEHVPFEDGTSRDESGIMNHESRLLKTEPPRATVLPFPDRPIGESVIDHHPETHHAIVSIFEDADEALVRTLIQKCVQEVIGVGRPAELVTDELIAHAIGRCTKRNQQSAGLYLTTVPTWFRNQALEDVQDGA